MNKYIILVDFYVKENHINEFISLLKRNSENSLNNESGCMVFDIFCVSDDNTHIVLHEEYSSRDEFEEHLKTSHFMDFDESVKNYVLSKKVTELVKLE